MPHDKNGQLLKAGDPVVIYGKAKSVAEGEFCTCEVVTDEVMPGNGTPTTIGAINCRQVVKAGPQRMAALGGFSPLVLVEYAAQINAAVTGLLAAGLPTMLVAEKCLHTVITELQAGKDAASIVYDLVTAWKNGTLS